MTPLKPFLILGAALAALAVLPSAALAGGPPTITITGTDGRDEIEVVYVPDPCPPRQLCVQPETGILVFGAQSVTGSDSRLASCRASNDGRSGRQRGFRCFGNTANMTVDLGGADDVLNLNVVTGGVRDPATFEPRVLTVNGGAGADTVNALWDGAVDVRGNDGDDSFNLPYVDLETGHTRNHRSPARFDGGAGRDFVEYGWAPAGVTLNLATGTGVAPTMPDTVSPETGQNAPALGGRADRPDTLAGIERIGGSPHGDTLTGGAAAEELLGQGGPDVLRGGLASDFLDGGPGSDAIDGGSSGDTVTGGTGRDDFTTGGGDVINSRDGAIEDVGCEKEMQLVADLVDKIATPEACKSVDVAAAKHRFDTRLPRRALRLAGLTLPVRVSCPKAKTERCEGVLSLRLTTAGTPLARTRYSVRRGAGATVAVPLSAATAKRIRNRAVTLRADEIDTDKRPRQVIRRVTIV